ncbi:hypothetical protein BSK20_05475 [SR1 bacterium human oral taxon HOT-345]|nr:hypothetical protein BSK20_05475 [SR1 bacterium human oral taxon HOT-345]
MGGFPINNRLLQSYLSKFPKGKGNKTTILVKKLLANYLQRCFERKNFRRFPKNDVFWEKMFGKWFRRDILGEGSTKYWCLQTSFLGYIMKNQIFSFCNRQNNATHFPLLFFSKETSFNGIE